jgi:hypothetical protein
MELHRDTRQQRLGVVEICDRRAGRKREKKNESAANVA